MFIAILIAAIHRYQLVQKEDKQIYKICMRINYKILIINNL